MKQGLVLLNNKIKNNNYPAYFVANIHDEWQLEVAEDYVETIGSSGVSAIREVSSIFNLRCPLDGEYKVGENWSETH
jgi:DNA polymerase-1